MYLGDCLDVMPDISEKSVDMILCDLPYGTTACKWDVVIPFEPLWKLYNEICKKDAIIALTGAQPFSSSVGKARVFDSVEDAINCLPDSFGKLDISVIEFYAVKKRAYHLTYDSVSPFTCDKGE